MSNQNKLRNLEIRRTDIIGAIGTSKLYRKKIVDTVNELNEQFHKKQIDYDRYYYKLNKKLDGRTPKDWIDYYDKCIKHYKAKLKSCENEIKKVKAVPIVMVLGILMIIGLGLFFLKPDITGFATIGGDENVSLIEENITNVTLSEGNITEENITLVKEEVMVIERDISLNKKEVSFLSDTEQTDIIVKVNVREVPQERIKLYKTTGGIRELVEIEKYVDSDNNGLIEAVEWTSDSSDDTYELIIEITKAEHLDENRDFISDIYEEIYEQDNVWSEAINDGEYVRVTFEQELDSSRDITIYPRVISGTPIIEVYEIDGSEVIVEFNVVNSNQYNKVFLTSLEGAQDSFDLKIVGGIVEFDHIIDPTQEIWFDCVDYTGWTATSWSGDPCGTGSNTIGSLISPVFSLNGDVSANFTYTYESSSKWDAGTSDSLEVRVSNDTGTHWYLLANYTTTSQSGTVTHKLQDYITFTANCQIGFFHNLGPAENAFVDNINVTSWAAAAPPVFASYYVNESLIGKNKYAKFNLSITDGDGVSYANGTINGQLVEFTDSGGDEWYYSWECLTTDSDVDFTWVGANDTTNTWNSTSVSGISVDCDADPPVFSGQAVNETEILENEYFCVNITITDAGTAA
ncbi:MAG: hypothetical protein KKH88_03445, partial [Nanoarchaeota archaeon]|nr:hypothetical protein [Nanoarchaeota archaeon]